MALMRRMVTAGEVDALVPERVWQEVSRGLMEKRPSRMFEVLRECGALARILPEIDGLFGVPQRADYHPEVDDGAVEFLRFGDLVLDSFLGSGTTAAVAHKLVPGIRAE